MSQHGVSVIQQASTSQVVLPRAEWKELLDQVSTGTTVVVGRVGTGKTTIVHWFATQLLANGARVGVVTCDMGQPMFGVPGAMWVSWGGSSEPRSGWFIGDNSPVGNLVPVITGAAMLVRAAREAGCEAVLVDTTGLVDGPLGRVLKLHKCLAVQADRAIIVDESERTDLAAILDAAGIRVRVIPPSPHSRNRTWEERRAYRESLFQSYFARTEVICVATSDVITADWHRGLTPSAASSACGRLCGLLDDRMYCRGLAIVDALGPGCVFLRTPEADVSWLKAVQLGRLQLSLQGRELRKLDR